MACLPTFTFAVSSAGIVPVAVITFGVASAGIVPVAVITFGVASVGIVPVAVITFGVASAGIVPVTVLVAAAVVMAVFAIPDIDQHTTCIHDNTKETNYPGK